MPAASDQLNSVAAVANALRLGDRFLLIGHVDPDPDCIGSLLALDWALTKLGKKSCPVAPDPVQPTWRFLPGFSRLHLPQEIDPAEWRCLVVVDCELSRIGSVAANADQFAQIINIDHHLTNPQTAPVRLVDPGAAASGELIYQVIDALGVPLDADAATLLYTAIMADTGAFRFSNTSARTLHIAAELVGLGAQPDAIARHIYETHSWGYLQLLQRVLATLDRSADGKVAWITVTADMLAQEGVRKDETEGLVQYPRMVSGVEIALVFREIGPQEVRVGFRSRERVDVSRLAREFGGGGHAKAAGCTIRLPLNQARAAVVMRAQQVLDDYAESIR